MARAYIDKIDITSCGRVIVSGQLSSTNLKASLNEILHIAPPADGIWNYELEVLPTQLYGGTMLVPFSAEAPWTGGSGARGLRISQANPDPNEPALTTTYLKASVVKDFTTDQKNMVWIIGAAYDAENKQIVVDVRHGGGCFPHDFALEWDGKALESFPVQYAFNFVDLSDYDPCKAIINTQVRFDIDTPAIQLDKPAKVTITRPQSTQLITLDIV